MGQLRPGRRRVTLAEDVVESAAKPFPPAVGALAQHNLGALIGRAVDDR